MPPRKSLPLAGPSSSTPRGRGRGRGRPSTSTMASASASRSKSTPSRSQHPIKRPRTSRGGPAHAHLDESIPSGGDDDNDDVLHDHDPDQAITTIESSTRQAGDETESAAEQQNANGAGPEQVSGAVSAEAEIDPEAELEAWQDFAHEHYEMVEQLPLELHRNFRLLRELDDGCIAQIDRLHGLVRIYAKERLALEDALVSNQAKAVSAPVPIPLPPAPLAEGVPIEAKGGDDGTDEAPGVEIDENKKTTEGQAVIEDPSKIASPEIDDESKMDKSQAVRDLLEGKQQVPGVPLPDGQGGLFIHVNPAEPETTVEPSNPPRNEFPHPPLPTTTTTATAADTPKPEDDNNQQQDVVMDDGQTSRRGAQVQAESQQTQNRDKDSSGEVHPLPQAQPTESAARTSTTAGPQASKKRKRSDGPHKHLPEIARLARELVRTAEEKVAVAVGAYNAIDRHIRALDSALTAQEASILLGLRPSTLPSTNVDDALNLAGDLAGTNNIDLQGAASNVPLTLGEGEDEEMVLGLGGGGVRRSNTRKRKGKKGKKAAAIKDEEEERARRLELDALQAQRAFNIPADPNEPRYCYCNQVSYGEMVGCDNDECPIEWFHITCTGLQHPPTGKWYCTVCQPTMGLGKGGAGKVAPKNIGASVAPGRKKK